MKKIFTLLTLIAFGLLFGIPKANATHVMGSDITWKCLGNDKFEITVTVYRDCNGAPLASTSIQILPVDCPGRGEFGAATEKSDPRDITPLCKKSCTRCTTGPGADGTGGSPPGSGPGCDEPNGLGIEQHVYTTILDLSQFPPECCKFTISYSMCCRNSTITTGAADQNFYVEATMNRCIKPCDNSPQFTNPPLAVYCLNHPITFNMGVNDPDVDGAGNADSLVYKFAEPLAGIGSTIPYTGGYAANKPLRFDGWPDAGATWNPPSTKGFHLDTFTGDLQFKPTKAEKTVFSISIESWGKDEFGKPYLKSITRRDMQIVIVACPNNKPPQLTGINGTQSTVDHFCVDQEKCFTVNSFDPDVRDSITMGWNYGIKGATFDIEQNRKHPRGKFCWKPGPQHVRTYPYSFVVNAQDDACPVNGRTTRSYQIYVHPTPEPIVTIKELDCGWMEYSVTPKVPGSGYSFSWSGENGLKGNTAFVRKHYKDPGRYKWSVTIKKTYGNTTCESTDTGSIVIKPYINVDLPKDTAVCVGTTIPQISAKAGLGSDPNHPHNSYTFTWSTGLTGKGLDNFGTIKNLNISKDTLFWVKVSDPVTGCENFDTIIVKAKQHPKPTLGPDIRKCAGEQVILDPKITEAKSTFEWSRLVKDPATGQIVPQLINKQKLLTVVDSGEFQITVWDSLKCEGTTRIKVFFNPAVKVQPQTVNACINEPKVINGGIGGPGVKWKWFDLYASNRLVNTTKDFNFVSNRVGERVYAVTAEQTINGVTCKSADTIIVNVKPRPVVKIQQNVPDQCMNSKSVNLATGNFVTPSGGLWSMRGKPLAVVGNVFYPDRAGYSKGVRDTLQYTYKDFTTGCENTVYMPILIDTIPEITLKTKTFCPFDATPVLDSLIVSITPAPTTGFKGVWTGTGVFLSGNTYALDLNAAGPPQRELTYTYTSGTGGKCQSIAKIIVNVMPKVKVSAGMYDPVCINNGKVTLQGTPPTSVIGQGEWKVVPPLDPASLGLDDDGRPAFIPEVAGVSPAGQPHRLVYEFSQNGLCMQRDTATIVVNPLPIVGVRAENNITRVCVSDPNVKLEGLLNNGVVPGGTFQPETGGQYIAGSNFVPSKAKIGTNEIRFTYQDFNTKCRNTATMVITVDDTTRVRIIPTAVACEGEEVELEAVSYNAQSVEWSSNGGTFSNKNGLKTLYKPTAQQAAAGRFDVTIKATAPGSGSVCGDAEATRNIIIYPKPEPVIDGEYQGCEPYTAQFRNNTSGDIAKYIWDFGDGNTSELAFPRHEYKKAGLYQVTLTAITTQGCSNTSSVKTVTVHPSPVAKFVANPTYTTITSPKIKFTNTSTGTNQYSNYKWDFGDGLGHSTDKDPEYSYIDTGLFTVKLTVRNEVTGCEDDTVAVGYISIRPEMSVFIPNAFTPNRLFNDRTIRNEEFTVQASDYGSFEMTIFNRWGEEMYYTTDRLQGWDGSYKGAACHEGVYIYVVKMTSISGKKYKYTGSITLLR